MGRPSKKGIKRRRLNKGSVKNKKIIFQYSGKERTSAKDEDLYKNIEEIYGRSMSDHSKKYTELLSTYIDNAEKSNKQKRRFKEAFFWISFGILFSSCVSFLLLNISVFIFGVDSSKTENIVALIASWVSLLTIYIAIPKLITDYLFNKEEDDNMMNLIMSIQNHDENLYKNIKDENKNDSRKDNFSTEIMKAMTELKESLNKNEVKEKENVQEVKKEQKEDGNSQSNV